MAGGESDEIEEESSVLWNSLLKQAQANFEASRANLAQARANEESSRAIHLLAQRMPSMGAIEVVPDRLESWYAAKTDAEAGITIAEQIAKQAEGLQDPRIGVGRGEGSEVAGDKGSRGRGAVPQPNHRTLSTLSTISQRPPLVRKGYHLFSNCFVQVGRAKAGEIRSLLERRLL